MMPVFSSSNPLFWIGNHFFSDAPRSKHSEASWGAITNNPFSFKPHVVDNRAAGRLGVCFVVFFFLLRST